MRKVIFTIFTGLLLQTLSAQDYTHAFGYRFGNSKGPTYKNLFDEINAFEVALSFRENGIQITPTVQFYQPTEIGNDHRFFWYYGFGAHVGYQRHTNIESVPVDSNGVAHYQYAIRRKKTQFVLGADVVFGLEYRILVLPFTLGIEYKPHIGFFGLQERVSDWTDIGFVIRYVIK